MPLHGDEIAGAVVRIGFNWNGRRVNAGERLTADDLKSMNNVRSMVNAGFIKTHPAIPAPSAPTERHMFHIGGGRYIVTGPALTPEPVTKEEAEAIIAGRDPSASQIVTAA